MRFIPLLYIICFYISPHALQAQTGYTKTNSGLTYTIIKSGTGNTYPEKGGFITFWFQVSTENDSLLASQFTDSEPAGMNTPDILHRPSIEEGLRLLKDGDSAVFILNADTLYANSFSAEVPDVVKGKNVRMTVKMDKVHSKAYVDSTLAARNNQLKPQVLSDKDLYIKDSLLIQDYLTKNKLTGVATKGGTYVVITRANAESAPTIVRGQSIRAGYVGKLLSNGQIFDQSQPYIPFIFTVGTGQVIKGWDEGFQKLKKGEKALFLIPSRSAYGRAGAGDGLIPPNAPLLFEVEVF